MQSSEVKRYLNILRRRHELFLVLALLLMTAVLVLSLLIPKRYEASCTVSVEKKLITDLIQGLAVVPSVEETINVLTISITSRPLLNKVLGALELPPDYRAVGTEELINRMQRNTTVKVKDKNIFTISYVDANPGVARDFVNTLVRLYVQESSSAKRGESADATDFLSGQLAAVTAKLRQTEAAITAFKLKSGGLVAIDEAQLLGDINTAQQRLYEVQSRRRQLEGMRKVTRKGVDPLQTKLVSLQNRLDDLRTQYTESYPEVVSLKGEIAAVKEQMRTGKGEESLPLDPQELGRIDSELDSTKTIEEGLRRFISSNRRVIEQVPAAKAELDRLETEEKNQKSQYDQLSSRRRQSELSKQVEVQDRSTSFRVVNPAILPSKAASPNRLMIMLIGIAGSLAASFGLLVLLDQMDSSVKEPHAVKELGAPLLAVIPKIEDAATRAKLRRRGRVVALAATGYFLILLCFPAMEFLRLPYLDLAVGAGLKARAHARHAAKPPVPAATIAPAGPGALTADPAR